MCTAISYKTKDHYFGRNLDLEYSHNESVIVTPRNCPFLFRKQAAMQSHYAMIGIGIVVDSYPLYYDATNEHGLSAAGLNFPGNAVYRPSEQNKVNITPFELVPWILAQCKSVADAKILLQAVNLVDIPFSEKYPLTPLHWIVSDRERSITVEPMHDGLKIYDNPIKVLTNNPPFDYHMHNLKNYLNLTRLEPKNRIAPNIDLTPYSRGMGAIGLPGDLSSSSRFVRAAFTLHNSVCDGSENSSISQFFHILGAVSQAAGCVQIDGSYEKTVYTSCCNTDKGIYYYTTYENNQITGVDMHKELLDCSALAVYPLQYHQQIQIVNANSESAHNK